MVRAALAVLFVAPVAVGQVPPPAAPPAAQPQPQQKLMDPALWQHLLGWEKVMQGATNFVSEKGTKTEFDARNQSTKTFDTKIWCLKPNMASMRLTRVPLAGQKQDPNEFETYICDGRSVFQYEGVIKTVTEHPLGPAGGIGDNLLLEFMSGSISARQAAQRFSIEWVKPDDPTYLILELTPLLGNDQKEFEKMTLVLVKPGLAAPLNQLAYLPRLTKVVKPNAQAIETWDFPMPLLNAAKGDGQLIVPADFKYVPPGKDWKVAKAAARPAAMPATGPRVARPNAP